MRQAIDKFSSQVLRFIPAILAFTTPLLFLPFTADYFAFNKYYFVTVLASISLIAWCVRNIARAKLHFTISPSFFFALLLVLANILSATLVSPTQHLSLFGQTALFTSLVIIFITATSSQKNETIVKSIVYSLIASAVLLSLYTILHYFGIDGKFISSELIKDKYFNLSGGILPALTFTLPVIIATVAYITGTKNWISKSILFAGTIVMIVASVMNISLLLPQDGKPVIALMPYSIGWSVAVDTFKTIPTALLGTGPETYFSAFTRLRPSYLNLDKFIWEIRFSESSSYLTTLLTTTGILGIIAFLGFFIKPITASYKERHHLFGEPTSYFFIFGLLASFLSFILLPIGIVSIVLGFVLAIGLTVHFKNLGLKETKDVNFSLASESQNQTTTAGSIVLPWFATVCSVSLLVAFWFYASQSYAASVNFKEATKIVETDAIGSFNRQLKASQLDSYNPFYQINLSQTYLAIAKSYLSKKDATDDDKTKGTDFAQRAIDSGRLAAKVDPYNVIVWENLARIYSDLLVYSSGSADMAISHFAQALALDPTNPKLHLQLGILFFNLGDSNQAKKLMDRSIELKQNWDLPYYNLSAIYKNEKDYTKALQYMKAGEQYTDPGSENLSKIQTEIQALEKLAPPPASTQSGQTK